MKEEWEFIAEYEGLPIQEAKLTYAARKDLPESAFCGPHRSYPAHDAAHVRNAFARLAQSKKVTPSIAKKIHSCLMGKAKRYGIEHKGCKWCEKGKKVEETATAGKIVDWFLKELGIECPTC